MHSRSGRCWRRIPFRLVVALTALLLAACGADEAAAPAPAGPSDADAADGTDTETGFADQAGGFPVAVDGVEIASRPERIVSLSTSLTEILFAVDAGDQVVAADEYSNYPSEAPATDLSGFQPNVEAIAAFDPDLVVASDDPGELVASLDALGIPTLLLPSAVDLDDVYSQIERLGAATGNVSSAAALVAQMQADIHTILATLDVPDEPLTYYHELTPDYYSVSSSSFIGEIYQLVGLVSIADDVGEDGGPYPQLSPEYIIEADPDLILLADADCCDVTPEEVAGRQGWDTITAVQNDAIVVLDEDIASRWGPRIVQLLEDVAEVIGDLEQAA